MARALSIAKTSIFDRPAIRLLVLAAATVLLAFVTPTPASANGKTGYYGHSNGYYGGRHHGRGYYNGGRRYYGGNRYYGRGHYGRSRYYGGRGYRSGRRYYGGNRYRGRYYGRSRGYYGGRYHGGRGYYGRGYRRGLSGGEVALIGAGIIGGAILIDRALDDRNNYDRYDRYYDRDRSRDNGRYGGASDARRGPWDDEYYYRRDDRRDDRDSAGRTSSRDGNDYGLEGGDEPFGNSPRETRRVTAQSNLGDYPRAAYQECIAETRGAAGAGGIIAALPAEPTRVDKLEDGGVRMTAVFTASNQRGETWRRVMTCEADDRGVAFLEIG